METIPLPTEQDTIAFGKRLAARLQPGDVVCLSGPLGAGKSTMARAIITAFHETARLPVPPIPSPTFTLVQVYTLPDVTLWHFDCYRISDPDELFETGWDEALTDGITLIEWPEKITPHLPVRRLDITLSGDDKGRVAEVERPVLE